MTEKDFPQPTIERFEALARDFGADLRRWPQAERGWAEDFARRTPDAQAILAEEQVFDARIADAVPDRASPELFAEILAARESVGWRRWLVALWPEASPARLAGLCAAALVVGILFGAALPVGLAPAPADDIAVAFDELIFDIGGEDLT